MSAQEPYFRPNALPEALATLSERPWVILAGGTNFYAAQQDRPITQPVLDITGLSELRGVHRDGALWRIGALTTWTDVIEATHLPRRFDGLRQAAQELGRIQIQNVATVCGNLCAAVRAADGPPNLLALDARVELRSQHGQRVIPIADFVTGDQQTVRLPAELVTGLLIPENDRGASGHFRKLAARRYLASSIVSIAAVFEWADEGDIEAVRLAIGGCGPVARRLPALEEALQARPASADLAALAQPQHIAHLAPLDDLRATAQYRRHAALTLLRRLLHEVGP